jgi:hypothetical protein
VDDRRDVAHARQQSSNLALQLGITSLFTYNQEVQAMLSRNFSPTIRNFNPLQLYTESSSSVIMKS